MVFFDGPIPVDQHIAMARPVNPTDPCLRSKQINCPRKNPNPLCDQSPYAIISDVVILIAVIFACCFLFYPYAMVLARKSFELGEEALDVLVDEIIRAPVVFGCLGLSVFFAAMALVAIAVCADGRCGRPGCRGLRRAAEFDIQLETEESVRKSGACAAQSGLKKELYEVQHKELEGELRKMAPVNGRAVLVFRGRCGCSVGRMEVLGPRKCRKVKK